MTYLNDYYSFFLNNVEIKYYLGCFNFISYSDLLIMIHLVSCFDYFTNMLKYFSLKVYLSIEQFLSCGNKKCGKVNHS